MKKAAVHGMKSGAVNEATNALLNGAGELLGADKYPFVEYFIFENNFGRQAVRGAAAYGLHLYASVNGGSLPVNEEAAKEACALTMENASREGWEPIWSQCIEYLERLEEIGESVMLDDGEEE